MKGDNKRRASGWTRRSGQGSSSGNIEKEEVVKSVLSSYHKSLEEELIIIASYHTCLVSAFVHEAGSIGSILIPLCSNKRSLIEMWYDISHVLVHGPVTKQVHQIHAVNKSRTVNKILTGV